MWDYRVVHHNDAGEDWYAVHVVSYYEDGKIEYRGPESTNTYGATIEGLKADMDLMMKAFDEPVLEADMFTDGGGA